jgi:hypothetical protein
MAQIDWAALHNPIPVEEVVQSKNLPNLLLDNPGLYYENGWYYIYYDHDRIEGDEREDETTIAPAHKMYKTRDFLTFVPVFAWHSGAPNMPDMTMHGSADMVKHNGVYYQTYQRWEPSPKNLLYAHSTSIDSWSTTNAHLWFAQSVAAKMRSIDPALAFHGSNVYLVWKSDSLVWKGVTHKDGPAFAVNRSGDPTRDEWHLLGIPDWGKSENYQLSFIDGKWRSISAGLDVGDDPYLFFFATMKGNGDNEDDWLHWDRIEIQLPNESDRSTNYFRSIYLADWRELDGFFYAIWATVYPNTKGFKGLLHMARSKDLKSWFLPGNTGSNPDSRSSADPQLGGSTAVSQPHSSFAKQGPQRLRSLCIVNGSTTTPVAPGVTLYSLRGQKITTEAIGTAGPLQGVYLIEQH